jgi:DNA repair protein RadD
VTVEHAGHVVEQFRSAGYQAAVLTGSTPDKERAQMIRDLGRGDLNVLASCNVVSEGTDIPAVAAAILLRPTASYSLAMQQIGRALRAHPGKDRAIILDHAGNTIRHGLPTEAVEWSLAGMGKRAKSAPVKRCFGCGAMVSAGAKSCQECGHAFPVPAHKEESTLPKEQGGELVEMTPEKLKELRRRRWREEKQAQSVEDLVKLGMDRGYKYPKKWAEHRFGELHG